MAHPYTQCEMPGCSQNAYFLVTEPAAPEGSQDSLFCCYGHAQSKKLANCEKMELPTMYATQCHSGDTWITCENHKNAYSLFASKSPKAIRTWAPCEICSVMEDDYVA